jgi:hypothetical protein
MKKRYAVIIVRHWDEKIIYQGELILDNISHFIVTCMERGLLLTNHYQIDPGCQPKIVTLGDI